MDLLIRSVASASVLWEVNLNLLMRLVAGASDLLISPERGPGSASDFYGKFIGSADKFSGGR